MPKGWSSSDVISITSEDNSELRKVYISVKGVTEVHYSRAQSTGLPSSSVTADKGGVWDPESHQRESRVEGRVQVSSSLKDCGDWPGEETGQETRRNCHFGPPGASYNSS